MSGLRRYSRGQRQRWRLYAGAALGVIAAYLLFGQLLIQAIAVLGFAVVGALAVLVPLVLLRARRMKPATPRPDYSLIASMERPIWGEAFEHAGAPATFTPAPVVYHPPAMNARGGIICGHERVVEIYRYGGGRAAEVCGACGERRPAGENGR